MKHGVIEFVSSARQKCIQTYHVRNTLRSEALPFFPVAGYWLSRSPGGSRDCLPRKDRIGLDIEFLGTRLVSNDYRNPAFFLRWQMRRPT